MAEALDRLGDRLVQHCEEGGLTSRVANLEEKINQLQMQLASFNFSRYRLEADLRKLDIPDTCHEQNILPAEKIDKYWV